MKTFITGLPSKFRHLIFLLLPLGLSAIEVSAQPKEITVKGIVISQTDNQPIPGVTIFVEGTTVGTTTDIDGNYSLDIPASAKEVTFSFIGFDTKKVPADQLLLLKVVTLVERTETLDDVVVVGFGIQKKESLVGAVQSVKPSSLKMTSSNLTSSFAGKIAGVISVQSSGEPGADGANFWIRGISTFGANKTPLIILDGVEITQTILNSIAPETIESFSILKDATATALYGSRGANGVMIVTTKSGRNSERMAINVRLENSFTMPTRITPVANGVDYMTNYNEARVARGFSEYYSEDKIKNTRLGTDRYIYPDVNWYDLLFKDFSTSQNANINLRGGGKKVEYFLNFSAHNEFGMLRKTSHSNYFTGDNMQKYTFQSNVSAYATKTTRVSLKMTTQLMNKYGTSGVASDLFNYTMTVNPVDFPAVYPSRADLDHVPFGNAPSWDGSGTQTNPYALLNQGYCNRFWGNVLATVTIDQDLAAITEGLRISGLASFANYTYSSVWNKLTPHFYTLTNYWMTPEGDYEYDLSTIGTPGSNFLEGGRSNSGNRIMNFQAKIDYARKFGKHDVSAALIYMQKEKRLNVPSASQSDILPFREQGLAGRVTYGFDSRYMAEFNFGYNGSENFAKGRRFGFFPSVAVGWVISNERFFEPIRKTVSLLKLRASYGLSGNDYMSDRFQYLSTIDMSSSNNEYKAFLGLDPVIYEGIRVLKWGNGDLTWETSRKTNLGIELGLFGDLTLIADLFEDRRNDIFMTRRSVPASSGFQDSTPYGNIGGVLNRGLDLSLEYNKAISRDLIISVQGSLTYAHNEVTFRDEPNNKPAYMRHKGKPVNAIEGLVAAGLFRDQADIDSWPTQDFGGTVMPGDIKYLDLNGDRKIDGNDVTMLGYPTVPEIIYGLGASIQYKNFDFSFFFQGVDHVSLEMQDHHPFVSKAYSGRNMTQWIADDHWSEANPDPNAAYPRLSHVWNENNTQASSFWIRNGAYLRLKSAEVGYTYRSFRFYVAGSNLFTISKFKLWDPELGSGNGLKYPLQRVVKLGLQYNF